MKRWTCSILAVLMLLTVFTTTAFASHGHHNWSSRNCAGNQICAKNETCSNSCTYTDENGDNICDNCENKCADCGKTEDENGDGICDNCGKCAHYQDEDGDGMCDHQEECAKRRNPVKKEQTGNCYGRKHRKHH